MLPGTVPSSCTASSTRDIRLPDPSSGADQAVEMRSGEGKREPAGPANMESTVSQSVRRSTLSDVRKLSTSSTRFAEKNQKSVLDGAEGQEVDCHDRRHDEPQNFPWVANPQVRA